MDLIGKPLITCTIRDDLVLNVHVLYGDYVLWQNVASHPPQSLDAPEPRPGPNRLDRIHTYSIVDPTFASLFASSTVPVKEHCSDLSSILCAINTSTSVAQD